MELLQDSTNEVARSNADAKLSKWFQSRRTAILVLAVFLGVGWTLAYFQFTVDDAYISFRYGKTFVQSHLWNWNPSGIREEAYTSAAYAFLSIIPAALRMSPALFFKFVGLACLGIMAFSLRRAASSQISFLLGVLLIAVNPYVWIHSYSGLETPLYMLLIFELGLCLDRANAVSPAYVYTLLLLLPLTRPEGILFSAVGLGIFWYGRRQMFVGRRYFILAAVAGIAYFLIRWGYFGRLLPTLFT